MKSFRTLTTGLVLAGSGVAAFISGAMAQQMGTTPYTFPARDPSFYAQTQRARNLGVGDTTVYSTTNNLSSQTNSQSSSTSVGNLNEISQILAGGASAYLGLTTDQASNGNQGSTANDGRQRHDDNCPPAGRSPAVRQRGRQQSQRRELGWQRRGLRRPESGRRPVALSFHAPFTRSCRKETRL